MQWAGFTLNMITLLALALAVGIVIDDAIVVLENIFRFMEEKKLTPREAAVEGTREIGLAVLATTLSLIAVFLPVAFMGGIVGASCTFGLTMAFAIAVSLLVGFTLTPMLSSRWLQPSEVETREELARARLLRLDRAPLPGAARLVAAPPLGGGRRDGARPCSSTVPLGRMANKNFLPRDDEAQFEVLVRAPEGTSLAVDADDPRLDRQARARAAGVQYTLVTIGADPQNTLNLGVDLREAACRSSERERRPVPGDGRDPQQGAAAVRRRSSCARRCSR